MDYCKSVVLFKKAVVNYFSAACRQVSTDTYPKNISLCDQQPINTATLEYCLIYMFFRVTIRDMIVIKVSFQQG